MDRFLTTESMPVNFVNYDINDTINNFQWISSWKYI